MAMGRIVSLCAVLALAGVASARAGDWDTGQPGALSYWDTRDAIYQKENLIARLEANPDIDEGYKGPVITAARAEIHRLRATLDPPQAPGPLPCCYTRKPLYIR
ncbi:MAG TPA: hypothetical protein VMR17_10175 [Xanthobacteraceae bacterium]|jgi:hypothetical protein|nr:hypothetical protein [Xanthobacteraceae bacterium]